MAIVISVFVSVKCFKKLKNNIKKKRFKRYLDEEMNCLESPGSM